MKNLLTFAFLFAYILVYGQTRDFHFQLEDFQINNKEGITYINSNQKTLMYGGPSAPAFPYFSCHFPLSIDVDSVNYDVDYSKILISSNVIMSANPAVYTTNGAIFSSYTSAQKDISYPVINGGIVHRVADKYLNLLITPFLYENGKLYFVSDIRINLTSYHLSTPHQQRNIAVITDTIDYLVITNQTLKESFDSLLEWKELKGLNTAIIDVETIYDNYQQEGDDYQLAIKRCIKDYKDNHATKWVLLGGDDTIVPSRMCDFVTGDLTPSDLYYACFTNSFDWDGNHNGYYGEVTDNISFNPGVYLSRLPVRTSQQVLGYINKLLRYERDVTNPDAAGRLLLTGYVSDVYRPKASAFNDTLYNHYIRNYWNGTKYYMYEQSSFLPDSITRFAESSNIWYEINRGYNLIHECSHGNESSWVLKIANNTFDCYDINFANTQTNTHPSVIVTNACHTNAFDNEICLSESLIRNPNGGAIAYLGSSREGYGVSIDTLTYSFRIDGCFFKNLFTGLPSNEPYRFAAVASMAKLDNIEQANTDILYHFLQISTNPIGDPELEIFTSVPIPFNHFEGNVGILGVRLYKNNFLNTAGIECLNGSTVVAKFRNGNKLVFRNTNQASFVLQDTCDIAVFKHNYIPQIYRNITPATGNIGPGPILFNVQNQGSNKVFAYLSQIDENNSNISVSHEDIPNGWLLSVSNALTGECNYSTKVTEAELLIDTSSWRPGIYVATGVVNGDVKSEKIIIK